MLIDIPGNICIYNQQESDRKLALSDKRIVETHYFDWTRIFALWNTKSAALPPECSNSNSKYKFSSLILRSISCILKLHICYLRELQNSSYPNCAISFKHVSTFMVSITTYVSAAPTGAIILDGRPVVDKEVGDNTEYFIGSRVAAVTGCSQA